MNLTEKEILQTLDNSNEGNYCSFVSLGDASSYLIDSRINVFRGDENRWAIAVERFGYNPRAGAIMLDIYYYGNCLIHLESYNGEFLNYYSIYPISYDCLAKTTEGEWLLDGAEYWQIRGQDVPLNYPREEYEKEGIELKEYSPGEIRLEEIGRLLVSKFRSLFRASDNELYKSIPSDLNKILVLDEWYHRDFELWTLPNMSQNHLWQTYSLNKDLGGIKGITFGEFDSMVSGTIEERIEENEAIRDENSPSAYETWQQIAKVIAANDPSLYQPTLEPNSHWSNWPESGDI